MADTPVSDEEAAKAKAAENRKKTGLGVAGGGYLLATRAKDIADPAAEMITRKPARIGADLHRIRTAYRAKRITRLSQRAGTAAIGAGVLLAGEGVASEMRHRHLIDQARAQLVRKALGTGEIDKALGLGALGDVAAKIGGTVAAKAPKVLKAVQATPAGVRFAGLPKPAKIGAGLGAAALGGGLIGASTGGNNQVGKALGLGEIDKADAATPDELRSRAAVHTAAADRAAANRRRASNVTLGTAAGGLAGFHVGSKVKHAAARRVENLATNVRGRAATDDELRSARRLGRVYRTADRAAGAAGVASLAAALGGGSVAAHYARKGAEQRQKAGSLKGRATRIEHRNQQQLIAQALGKSLGIGDIDKAFDPEMSRHNRQSLYEGALTGGSVVAGAAAAGGFGRAVGQRRNADAKLAEAHLAHEDVKQRLSRPGTKNAMTGRRLMEGEDAAKEGAKFATSAHRMARGSKAAAALSAGLAGAAYGVHRHDATRGATYYGY